AVRYHGTAMPNVGGTVSPLPSVVSSAPGRIGQAIQFAGITGGDSAERRVDYGNVANHGTGGYTVSFWFNPEVTSGTQFVASKGNAGSTSDGWSVWLNGTSVIVRGKHDSASANRVQLSKGGLVEDNWHHVTLVIDDTVGDGQQGVLVAYLDGVGSFDYGTETLVTGWTQAFDGYKFPDGASFATSTSLRLGARATTGAEFQGMIDDFAIWNRALSAAEIATIYQMGLQGLTPIPEPASAMLVLLGLLAITLLPRRSR
ncbi:MAG: LamG domain-containing protein, partial [Patescibacteria group bacterium]|nr:LamG domain-containing protein [Patescibacteria group bacterium]